MKLPTLYPYLEISAGAKSGVKLVALRYMLLLLGMVVFVIYGFSTAFQFDTAAPAEVFANSQGFSLTATIPASIINYADDPMPTDQDVSSSLFDLLSVGSVVTGVPLEDAQPIGTSTPTATYWGDAYQTLQATLSSFYSEGGVDLPPAEPCAACPIFTPPPLGTLVAPPPTETRSWFVTYTPSPTLSFEVSNNGDRQVGIEGRMSHEGY